MENISFTIRKAQQSDIEAIKELVKANPKTIVARQHQEYLELLDSFWVAESQAGIVGCVCLELYSKKICEIRTLIVDRAFRSLGIGDALMKTALEAAKKLNVPQILIVTSDPAYFERLGFGTELNEKYAMFYQKIS